MSYGDLARRDGPRFLALLIGTWGLCTYGAVAGPRAHPEFWQLQRAPESHDGRPLLIRGLVEAVGPEGAWVTDQAGSAHRILLRGAPEGLARGEWILADTVFRRRGYGGLAECLRLHRREAFGGKRTANYLLSTLGLAALVGLLAREYRVELPSAFLHPRDSGPTGCRT
ncbi:MAG: hypothetical protein HY722_16505 [Planctomycetes bacterium]|nr:hypothetical protein [Planctomycetota bacterium]